MCWLGRLWGGALAFVGGLVLAVAACAPVVKPAGPAIGPPHLLGVPHLVEMRDGAQLPLHTWLPPDGEEEAVILALHGFNDYGNFFAGPGAWFADHGVAAYAYDQRGFGRAPNRRLWPGSAALTQDLRDAVRTLRARHPAQPLFVLGESMGGAVILVAATTGSGLDVDGVILSAPAVWGRSTMPWYQRVALWIAVRTIPSVSLTGRGLGVQASDNIEMLRSLGRDPHVIKGARVDAIHGLVDLMDKAFAAAPDLDQRTLILVGDRDQLVPRAATNAFTARLPVDAAERYKIAAYPDGWHMLLRDLSAETVWTDIKAWMADPGAPLPSAAEIVRATPSPNGHDALPISE